MTSIFQNLFGRKKQSIPVPSTMDIISELKDKINLIEKRIFIVGPPGSKIREHALELSNYLNYTCISVGDLLIKEISKKSDLG